MEEERKKGIVSNSMLILSFLCPFLVAISTSSYFSFWLLYAPVWVVGIQEGKLMGGPTPMGLLLFLLWIPYVYVGWEFKRLAEGKLESWFDFALRVLIAAAISVIFIVPSSFVPSGGTSEGPIYTQYIPLPILPILALIVGWKFKADSREELWEEEESEPEDEETDPLRS